MTDYFSRLSLLAIVLCVALLVGCSTVSGWINGNPPRTALRKISVQADVEANQGVATMLDLVFVYDAALLPQLPKTGPDWFRQKAALQLTMATGIDVIAMEVPATSPLFVVKMPERASKAIGVFALANYVTEGGQPIANLTPWREVTIRLMPKTIAYSGT